MKDDDEVNPTSESPESANSREPQNLRITPDKFAGWQSSSKTIEDFKKLTGESWIENLRKSSGIAAMEDLKKLTGNSLLNELDRTSGPAFRQLQEQMTAMTRLQEQVKANQAPIDAVRKSHGVLGQDPLDQLKKTTPVEVLRPVLDTSLQDAMAKQTKLQIEMATEHAAQAEEDREVQRQILKESRRDNELAEEANRLKDEENRINDEKVKKMEPVVIQNQMDSSYGASNNTIQMIMLILTALGLFLAAIVNWDKLT